MKPNTVKIAAVMTAIRNAAGSFDIWVSELDSTTREKRDQNRSLLFRLHESRVHDFMGSTTLTTEELKRLENYILGIKLSYGLAMTSERERSQIQSVTFGFGLFELYLSVVAARKTNNIHGRLTRV
jgi:hypothetical protein